MHFLVIKLRPDVAVLHATSHYEVLEDQPQNCHSKSFGKFIVTRCFFGFFHMSRRCEDPTQSQFLTAALPHEPCFCLHAPMMPDVCLSTCCSLSLCVTVETRITHTAADVISILKAETI